MELQWAILLVLHLRIFSLRSMNHVFQVMSPHAPSAILGTCTSKHVHDCFAIFENQLNALSFLGPLNSMHSSLQFAMESEENDRLHFLDVIVIRCDDVFLTTIYRKISFTGLYVQWESLQL